MAPMGNRWRKSIVLLLLLWLPLQGFAASGMAFCRHEQKQPEHHMMQGMHGCCHEQMQMAEPSPQPDQHSHHHGANCDNCGYCHLSSFTALPAVAPLFAASRVTRFPSFAIIHPASYIPEQLQRPPLAA